MKNLIMNWLAGNKVVSIFLGIQGMISGWKTYTAGTILILQGGTCLIEQVSGLGGLSDALNFAKNLPGDPCLTKMAEGLGLMGLRAAASKMGVKTPA